MKFIKSNWYWLLPVLSALIAAILYAEKTGAINLFGLHIPKGLDKDAVLYNGVQGKAKEVKFLQGWLNSKGQNLTEDGVFGQGTAKALFDVTGKWDTKLKDLK